MQSLCSSTLSHHIAWTKGQYIRCVSGMAVHQSWNMVPIQTLWLRYDIFDDAGVVHLHFMVSFATHMCVKNNSVHACMWEDLVKHACVVLKDVLIHTLILSLLLMSRSYGTNMIVLILYLCIPIKALWLSGGRGLFAEKKTSSLNPILL